MPSSAEWLVFLGTATLFAIMPGPGLFYVLARSLHGGRSEGIRSVVGNGLGACVHVVAAAFGLSAVLATSATAFMIIKLAGAAYLVYLGVRALSGRAPAARWSSRARWPKCSTRRPPSTSWLCCRTSCTPSVIRRRWCSPCSA